ncbi:3'-5' exoribonuclease [Burkholderia sp. BCC1638]|uniref:3'-5' exoribonuclease n=1 Tax=Burkholderia sp. BCC1638 TaxID=2681391 RepID=UPI00158BA3D4|nr:3'-5' exoribonuclease [Burkholderia sp. BCC1638]
MLLFLDTEYTGLKQQTPRLVSLGIVSEDGRRELYMELADTWKVDDCTAFVRREVLPLLEGTPITFEQGRSRLREWFLTAPRTVQIACDSSTDFAFLLELLGTPLPTNLASTYYDLRPLIDTTVYDQAVSNCYRKDNRIHHALVDARAYRRGWLAWMDARKVAVGGHQNRHRDSF